MYQTRFNSRCYSGTKWSCEDGGEDDDEHDVDDDPNEVQLDDDGNGDDFPPPGRNFPDKFLSAFFSLLVSVHVQRTSPDGTTIFPLSRIQDAR